MRFGTFAGVVALSLLAAFSSAQILQVSSGDFSIIAQTQAGPVNDLQQDSGNVALTSYSRSMQSYSEYTDPDLGLHYARGATSLNWSQTTNGGLTTLHGSVGGVAEAWSNGLDTYALGASTVGIYFDITSDAVAFLESEGTYNTDIYIWNNGVWDPFFVGLNGPVPDVFMPTGQYKLSAGAGEAVSGSNFYSSGIEFWVKAEAVPEPGSIAAVGLGLLILFRRKRRA